MAVAASSSALASPSSLSVSAHAFAQSLSDARRAVDAAALDDLVAHLADLRSRVFLLSGDASIGVAHQLLGELRALRAQVKELQRDMERQGAAAADELAAILVNTVTEGYKRTGFVWENYSADDGHGRGTHPFTGWSALVTLLVAGRFPV